jgi:hypothetical protein
MLVGKREYGTWKDGSSIYKDGKGYYYIAVNANGMYKKYLKNYKPSPASGPELCFTKKRWRPCKGTRRKNK